MTQNALKKLPSLPSRIAFVFGIAIVAIACTMILLFRANQVEYLEKQARNRYQQLGSVLLISSSDAIIAEDLSLLANVVEELGKSDTNLALVEITNDENRLLAKWETPRKDNAELISIRPHPIVISGKEQGAIHLLVDLSHEYQQINAFVLRNSFFIVFLLMGLMGVLLLLVRREAIEPIQKIEDRLLEIEHGLLEHEIDVGQTKEIAQLGLSLNQVSKTLYKQREAERTALIALEELNNAYVRFVPEAFLTMLEKDMITRVGLGDHRSKYISILFSDIRSFTTMAESMTAAETFAFINEYLEQLGPVVRQNNGFIDKYIGDAIMAIFSNPDDAVRAGIKMLEALEVFNAGRKGEPTRIGIGVHTGEVMLGTIGEKFRMEGTVIGDVVNLAARLETLTKDYNTPFLISEVTKSELKQPERYSITYVAEVLAKGKVIPTKIYSVCAAEPK